MMKYFGNSRYTVYIFFTFVKTNPNTMKKTVASFNFKFSYADLIGLGEKTNSLMGRDQEELLTYSVNDQDRTAIAEATAELQDLPTDDEYKGTIIEFTATKDKLADEVKVGIRTFMVRVADAFGENSGTYSRFGTAGLSKLADLDLLQCCKRVLRMANTYSAQLQAKGLTAAMIEGLNTNCTQLDLAIAAKEDAVLAREVATEHRVTLANDLYARIVRISGFGKDYWYTRNEAKYNDYIIYDTPTGTKETTVPPVTPA